MKQHITKEQWENLNNKERDEFTKNVTALDINVFNATNKVKVKHEPTIGQMIEFLGDDLERWDKGNSNGKVAYALKIDGKQITAFELVDALWSACKYKLNENKSK